MRAVFMVLVAIWVCACGGRVGGNEADASTAAGSLPDGTGTAVDGTAPADATATGDVVTDGPDARYPDANAVTCATLDACCAKLSPSESLACSEDRAACMGDNFCCYGLLAALLDTISSPCR